jgi:hypothetical protein
MDLLGYLISQSMQARGARPNPTFLRAQGAAAVAEAERVVRESRAAG